MLANSLLSGCEDAIAVGIQQLQYSPKSVLPVVIRKHFRMHHRRVSLTQQSGEPHLRMPYVIVPNESSNKADHDNVSQSDVFRSEALSKAYQAKCSYHWLVRYAFSACRPTCSRVAETDVGLFARRIRLPSGRPRMSETDGSQDQR